MDAEKTCGALSGHLVQGRKEGRKEGRQARTDDAGKRQDIRQGNRQLYDHG